MAPVTDLELPRFGGMRVLRISAPLAVAAGAATAIAVAFDPRRALLGYLAAYAAVAAVAIGALVLLLIGYATNARWLSPLRRLHEGIAGVFPVLALLFIPIAAGLEHIYFWADPPPDLSEHQRHLLHAKRAWLDPAAFVIRSVLYLAVFVVASEVLRRWSRRRDERGPAAADPGAADPAAADPGAADPAAADPAAGDPEAALRRERMFGAAMLPPVGLALTFAAFDWLMSLQPAWTSSMFPVYYFAGGFGAGIALLAILAQQVHTRERAALVTRHHFHALGRLLLAFVVFWAYTAYFQGFLIQIADRPNEIVFFLVRTRGGWDLWLWVMVAAHFAIPFLLLLPRSLKLRPRHVAAVAAVVLLGHVLDIYWLVLPTSGSPVAVHWADATSLVAIACACLAFGAWRLRGEPIAAAGDPLLPEGVRYESPT